MRPITTSVTTSFVVNHSINGATPKSSSMSNVVSSTRIKPICKENSIVLPNVRSTKFAAVAASAATKVTSS